MSNLAAIRYLTNAENDALDSDLHDKLLYHLREGRDKLSNFQNGGGGYAMWSGGRPSVLHTALALSVLGGMKDFVPVSNEELTNAQRFLRENQDPTGSYVSDYFSDATVSTAYILHAQAVAGITDKSAWGYLLDDVDHLDVAALALTTKAAVMRYACVLTCVCAYVCVCLRVCAYVCVLTCLCLRLCAYVCVLTRVGVRTNKTNHNTQ